MKLSFKSRLNVLLSELLNQMGVISRAEHIGQGRKDIIIFHQGLAIVLEGSYDLQDAEKLVRCIGGKYEKRIIKRLYVNSHVSNFDIDGG